MYEENNWRKENCDSLGILLLASMFGWLFADTATTSTTTSTLSTTTTTEELCNNILPQHDLQPQQKDQRKFEDDVLCTQTVFVNQKQKKNEDRKVRFEIDENNQVQTHVRTFYVQLGEKDVRLLWWSKDELFQSSTHLRQVSKFYANSCKGLVEEIFHMLGRCNMDGSSLSDSQVQSLIECQVRGLESFILPHFDLNRKKVVQDVLMTQSRMRNYHPEIRMKELSAISRKLTVISSTLARSLAIGDEFVAMCV